MKNERFFLFDLFHPKKTNELPDINLKLLPEYKVHVRRCTECNSILTGLDIVIVRDDVKQAGFETLTREIDETELYEAIYCTHCGHQNILGKYYRPASDHINQKAQIIRKDSKEHELTPNMMRELMGLNTIHSEETSTRSKQGGIQ